MAQKTFDPKAKYVCLHGKLSIKGERNNRRYIDASDVDASGKKVQFTLSHLKPQEVAFLALNLRQVMPAAEYEAQQKKAGK
jgi:hypothetical protein